MVIDKGKLIALLVDKTGRSTQEVEEQLNELTEQIEQAATSGRQFHIEGFGTFGMDEGTIYFDPASQFKTEINQKYAGMKPIELMAAFKESGAGVPVEEVKEKPVAPEPSEPEPEETVPDVVDEPEKQQPEPVEETAEKSTKEKPEAAPVPPVSTKKEKQPAKKKPVATGKSKEERDPLGSVLIAAVVVIGLLVGGWLVYDSGILSTLGSGNTMGSIPADTTAQNTDQPQPAASDSMLASGTATDSTEQNTSDEVSENRVSGAASSPYGLKGAVNDQAENAYTIVIHSFRLRSTVQEIADSLDQRGYRTVLFEGTANDGSRWRLGLGQFKSIPDAQDAVQQLSEPYRENHFITRIQ